MTTEFRDPGTYTYHPELTFNDTLRAQNLFLEKIAQAVDAEFPPEELSYTFKTSPGEIVRRYIVPIGQSTEEVKDGH